MTDNGNRLYAEEVGEKDREKDRLPHGLSIQQAATLGLSRSLSDILISVLVERPGKPGFIPNGFIDKLIVTERVFDELHQRLGPNVDKDEIRRMAKTICSTDKARSFKKIFATLIMACVGIERISDFLKNNVSDADLPLSQVPRHGETNSNDLRRRKDPEHRPLEFFRSWSLVEIRAFEREQWLTQAPYFSRMGQKHVKHWVLHSQARLPFIGNIEDRGEPETESCFSRVFKVDIHHNHHNFHGPGPPGVSPPNVCSGPMK